MSPWLLVLVPAVAAALGVAVRRDDRLVAGLATLASGATLLLALVAWIAQRGTVIGHTFPLPVGELHVPLGTVKTRLRSAVARLRASLFQEEPQ